MRSWPAYWQVTRLFGYCAANNPVVAKAAGHLHSYRKQQQAEEAALAEEQDRLEREKVVLPLLPEPGQGGGGVVRRLLLVRDKTIPDFQLRLRASGGNGQPGAPLSKDALLTFGERSSRPYEAGGHKNGEGAVTLAIGCYSGLSCHRRANQHQILPRLPSHPL